jgi:hypothetical protein
VGENQPHSHRDRYDAESKQLRWTTGLRRNNQPHDAGKRQQDEEPALLERVAGTGEEAQPPPVFTTAARRD